MSGPGLTTWEAHHAIHQAAFDETERLTRLLRQAMFAQEREFALKLAGELIEYWQTHTLQHAEAEETGWYREIVTTQPERQADVTMLTRDHDLLRILLAEIQGLLAARGITSGIVERFEAMLLVNAIHSREEERRLLQGNTNAAGSLLPNNEEGPVELLTSSPQTEPYMETIPLIIANPSLHAQLAERLRAHGLRPSDLRASLRRRTTGTSLHIVAGRLSPQEREWSFLDEGNSAATDEILSSITQWCETTIKADYHTFMRNPL